MTEDKPYRRNAGALVFNAQAQVLVGERLNYPDAWQFPQGGIDKGEEPRAGAIRELFEEVGLRLHPVAELPDWLCYDFPANIPRKLKKFRGQKQRWFLFFWEGNPDLLDLENHEREFERVRWMDFEDVLDQIVPFKQPLYRALYKAGRPLMETYLAAEHT